MLPAIEEISTEEVVAPKPKMGGGINIPMPKGFKIPQGKKDGDTIEVIAKVRPMGGKLMVESLDGFELSNAEEEATEETESEDEAVDKEAAKELGQAEDEDEQFASELSSAIRQMK
jgi:hypothetical protein